MTTLTAVKQVLRLRHLLDVRPADSESFACGVCWPYACDCSGAGAPVTQKVTAARTYPLAHAQTSQPPSQASSSSSPRKSFLSPINFLTHQSRTVPGKGRQTNIEQEKFRRLSAVQTLAPCTRCAQPMPSSLQTTVASNSLNTCRSCRIITSEELAKHTTKSDLWIAISGGAYDVSKFVDRHPGGILTLLDVAGCDASDVFRAFHPTSMNARLPGFQVGLMGEFDQEGRLIDGAWTETPLQKDFNQMLDKLEADGQFVTSMAWYCMKTAVLASMWFAAVGLIVFGQHWTAYFASALILGMFFQQMAFVGHDVGHNSVRGGADADWLPGWVVTSLFGVSVAWWKRSHNVHHVVTNAISHDPDIQYLPVFGLSEKQFDGFYSTYHQKTFSFDHVCRSIVAYQHYLYYPVMMIARINLHLQSLLLLADVSKQVRHRAWEWAAMVVYFAWYGTLMSYLPDWQTKVWFFFLCHAVAGLVHVQITLSHFAMPVYHGRGYSHENISHKREHFLRTQFDTSMDIVCPTWMDWLHGGLQFQVTHHLIPRVPRHRLRHVMDTYLKPFAAAHGLIYHEETFLNANKTVFASLKNAAEASRKLPQTFTESYLWQGLNAEG